MASFDKFGEEFQSKVLYHLVTDKMFALQIIEVLDPSFFTDDSYQEICNIIFDWNGKYNTIPSFNNIKTIVQTKYEDEIEQNYLADLVEAIKSGVDILDKEFVVDETIQFCKQQAVKNAILESVDLLKKEKYDSIYSVIKKAMTAGEGRSIGHEFSSDVFERTVEKRNPIPTGLGLIDNYIAGGLSNGDIGLIMAGTGVGKSMILAYIAAHAFSIGKNVVYYTLELSETMVGLRLDSRFTNIALTDLLMDYPGEHRSTADAAIKAIKEEYKDTKPDLDIKLKFFPTKSVGVKAIKNHLTTMKNNGFEPDLVIVDYSDLLKPEDKYNDKRFELEGIVEQLRGLAGEYEVPVWTATQTNREGLDASIVGLKAISEALAKAMVADLIISIGRTPQLIADERACYYIPKSRLGPTGLVFTGPFDTSVLNFSTDQEGLDSEEDREEREHDQIANAVRGLINQNANRNNNNLNELLDSIGE